jgi:hypothetical protein
MVRQGTARRCLSFCLMLEQSKTLQCEERRRVGFSTWDVLLVMATILQLFYTTAMVSWPRGDVRYGLFAQFALSTSPRGFP